MIEPFTLSCDSTAFAVLSKEILQSGKALRFRARGTSMQPLIRDGDRLFVIPGMVLPYCVGDPVLFICDQQRAVLHRVIRRSKKPSGWAYLIQGDQQTQPDGWIDEQRILGKLVSLERKGLTIRFDVSEMVLLNKLAACQCLSQFRRTTPGILLVNLLKQVPRFRDYLT